MQQQYEEERGADQCGDDAGGDFGRSKENAAQQICQNNPEYFHQMAPYALALGVEKRFAKRFGGIPIGPCPYITSGGESTMHAAQWAVLMRRVLNAMNARQQNRFLEKVSAVLRLLVK